MPETSLVKKLKLKPDQRAAVIHAPEDYLKQLRPRPAGAELETRLTGKEVDQPDFRQRDLVRLCARPYRPGEPRQTFR